MDYEKVIIGSADSSLSRPIEFKTVVEIIKGTINGRDELVFVFADDIALVFYHEQDCCERVYIDDIEGDLNDLIGTPLLLAEVVSSNDDTAFRSATWTFYKFATTKGYVTVRWYGVSNGYYSERVHQATLTWNKGVREGYVATYSEIYGINKSNTTHKS